MSRVSRRALSVALAGSAVALLSAAPSQAAFTAPYNKICNGDSIVGEGASFQLGAQTGWIGGFKNGYLNAQGNQTAPYCGPSTPFAINGKTITFNSTGSGAGVSAFGAGRSAGSTPGVRSATDRYIAFDEAPTAGELANMNNGLAGTSDDGVLRQIPIATGSATISVHAPAGCKWSTAYDWKPNTSDNTTRFKLPSAKIEQVFDGSTTTWGALFGATSFKARPGNPQGRSDADCRNFPITRVVRADSSGTTFVFKNWLHSVDPAQGWDTLAQPANNTVWPSGSTLVTGSKNSGVADAINANEGSFGYVDLATARSKGFDITGTADPLASDTTFWIPVRNGAGTYADPQSNGLDGYKSGATIATKGANCVNAVFTDSDLSDGDILSQPDPTTAPGWDQVLGINSQKGYGICVMTFMGVWDDYADVYGNTTGEQAQARTAKDYVTYALNGGSNILPTLDYQKLPTGALSGTTNFQTLAKNAIAAVDWNK